VKAAYHRACTPCAKSKEVCPFCCKLWKEIDKTEGEEDAGAINEDDFEGEDIDDEESDDARGAAEEETEVELPPHFCLEVQAPFAAAIIEGKKTVETRTYELPEHLLNVPISIVETCYPDSFPDAKKLPSEIPAGSTGGARSNWEGWTYGESKMFPSMTITHTVTFKSCFKYTDIDAFLNDKHRHCVDGDSSFNVMSEETPMFGWEVDTIAESPYANMPLPCLTRIQRSIFEVKHVKKQLPSPVKKASTSTAPPLPPNVNPANRDQNFHGRAPVVPGKK
jgi:hypothetical protein